MVNNWSLSEKIKHSIEHVNDINSDRFAILSSEDVANNSETLIIICEFDGHRVTDVEQIKGKLLEQVSSYWKKGSIVVEIVRPNWLANQPDKHLNQEKYIKLIETRKQEILLNTTYANNITEAEKDAFQYFGKEAKIRTPTHITYPGNIHIGNWASLGRNGKIFMQTCFEPDVYIQQHYPEVEYHFEEGIVGKRNPKLKIADGATIGDFFFINCNLDIQIGKHAGIADRVYISDANHLYKHPDIPIALMPNEIGKPIMIGEHCWIGINAVILGGITIGKHAIVSSNTVVTKDVPPYSLAMGNPARILPLKMDSTAHLES